MTDPTKPHPTESAGERSATPVAWAVTRNDWVGKKWYFMDHKPDWADDSFPLCRLSDLTAAEQRAEAMEVAAHKVLCESNGVDDNEWHTKQYGTIVPVWPIASFKSALAELEAAMLAKPPAALTSVAVDSSERGR